MGFRIKALVLCRAELTAVYGHVFVCVSTGIREVEAIFSVTEKSLATASLRLNNDIFFSYVVKKPSSVAPKRERKNKG